MMLGSTPQYRLKDLFLIPMAGLANRMLAIASAKRLCSMAHARCNIAWEWGAYTDIFDDPSVRWVPHEELDVPDNSHFVRHLLLHEGGNCTNRRVPLSQHESVVVMSWFIFNGAEEAPLAHEDDLDLAPWLPMPVPAVMQRVIRFRERHFSERTVGIHVRRTDNLRAIEGSPDDLYFRLADDLVADGYQVFLSTDNSATEMLFRTRYGDAVIQLPKNPDLVVRMPRPFRLEDTWDDLTDLWLLGSCAFVIGSAFSSFSKVAKMINGSTRSRLLGDAHRS